MGVSSDCTIFYAVHVLNLLFIIQNFKMSDVT